MIAPALPAWVDPTPWHQPLQTATPARVEMALATEEASEDDLAALLSPAADSFLERMAQRARELTRYHFGPTINLYIPLYLSDYCSGGCRYCGFAADRQQPRKVLTLAEVERELGALKAMGFEEVLLLTGERAPEADGAYVRQCVQLAATRFHRVTLEAFPMDTEEYRAMADAGCTGVTLYQETYDPPVYDNMHRWGAKKDFQARLDAPRRILDAGVRTAGMGVLFGLADPRTDAMALFRHLQYLRKRFWQAGFTISFPRLCPEVGGFTAPHPVGERLLAQIIFAFRICCPDVPLVLSTRESPRFRDGMAGLGISKMSIASRTTVGGYHSPGSSPDGQFHVNDNRDPQTFCTALRARGLEPVFKNWESIYR